VATPPTHTAKVIKIEKFSSSTGRGAAISKVTRLRKQVILEKEAQAQDKCKVWEKQAEEDAKTRLAQLDRDIETCQRDLCTHAKTIITQIDALKTSIAEIGHAESTELIQRICQNFVASTYRTDPAALSSIIQEEIEKFSSDATLIVKLHPADATRILEIVANNSRQVRIEPDESLTIGDYLIESKSGKIDGRLSRKFEQLRDSLNTAFSPNDTAK